MNEKTKQILRYVACGLGGLALGIGLLGGLSMCATSNNTTAESVNTIYASPKRQQITTSQGGYTGYTFSLPTAYPTTEDGYFYKIYELRNNTYTPVSRMVRDGTLEGNERSYLISMIETAYEEGRALQTATTSYRYVLTFYAYTDPWPTASTDFYRQIAYITFIEPSYPTDESGFSNADTAFVLTNAGGWDAKMSLNYPTYSALGEETLFTLTNSKTSFYCYGQNLENQTLVFQDVVSYYKELGYQDGYEDGYSDGDADGYDNGYDFGESAGYSSGYADGYGNGYADGFDDGADNALLFTDLGVNQLTWASSDLSWDDSTDTTQTMKLFDFKDGENSSYYVTLTDYSLGGGNAIVQVFKNGTASNNEYATIARGTWNGAYTQLEIIPSTYLKFEFAQMTTYYHNSIPNGWFTLSGIPANATGYEVGYQTGYREGYLASPGGEATQNVFSLFTNAFDSVGGIFNLKIFGFLPLYWFFLTPIFIAIITLLIRMVKH